jgi:iron complex outermembrane receptor protein
MKITNTYLLSKFTFLFLISLNISTVTLAQQNAIVKGTVKTSDGQPAQAVSVGVKNTAIGTMTNVNGNFQFKLKPGTYIIRVSAIGLVGDERSVTVAAGSTTIVDFALRENASQLKEVIISDNKQKFKIDNPSPTLRLNEPLLQIPQNIQVVSNDQIQEQQIFNMLEGVSRNVSGLTMQEHWGNYARVNGRGDRIAAFRNG